jgi:N-acetylglutamate synthase-like GNAT family acetyltransferase
LDDLRIRPAAKDDARPIRTLVRSVRINPIGLDWRRFLLAVSPDGNMLGCGQIKFHADGSLELASIAVHPESRHTGVARRIITALLEREPARPIYLMCRSELESFYAQFGFAVIDLDELPAYFRRIKRLIRVISFLMEEGDGPLIMRKR